MKVSMYVKVLGKNTVNKNEKQSIRVSSTYSLKTINA